MSSAVFPYYFYRVKKYRMLFCMQKYRDKKKKKKKGKAAPQIELRIKPYFGSPRLSSLLCHISHVALLLPYHHRDSIPIRVQPHLWTPQGPARALPLQSPKQCSHAGPGHSSLSSIPWHPALPCPFPLLTSI